MGSRISRPVTSARHPALRLLGGVGRGLRRALVVTLAVALTLIGVYVGDLLASERLFPTIPPQALLAAGSPPCAEASLAIVTASGAGRQTSYEMAALLVEPVRRFGACVVILDYGSVMDTRGNVAAILASVTAGRPAGQGPLPLVLLGNSTGGIEVQREANLFYARHRQEVRLMSVVADSTPAEAADLKPPLTQDLAQNCTVPLGHFLGQNIVRLWQAYEEVSRRGEDLRDVEVLRRIQANTEAMQARLTMSQLCMIAEGYPWINVATPRAGVPHAYVRPADPAADEVVQGERAAAGIDQALGGGLEVVEVPGGSHGAAYLLWPVYEAAYLGIIARAHAAAYPPVPAAPPRRPV